MTRGGKREGAGRKTGVKIGPETIPFHRRVTPIEAKKLDEHLKYLRTEYCQHGRLTCDNCSLVNYGRDCHNNKVDYD